MLCFTACPNTQRFRPRFQFVKVCKYCFLSLTQHFRNTHFFFTYIIKILFNTCLPSYTNCLFRCVTNLNLPWHRVFQCFPQFILPQQSHFTFHLRLHTQTANCYSHMKQTNALLLLEHKQPARDHSLWRKGPFSDSFILTRYLLATAQFLVSLNCLQS